MPTLVRAPSGLEAREVCERRADAAGEPQAGRLGAALQGPRGDHVGVAEQLADDQSPAGTQDPCDLAQRRLLIRDLAEDGDQDGRVEGSSPYGRSCASPWVGLTFHRPRSRARRMV